MLHTVLLVVAIILSATVDTIAGFGCSLIMLPLFIRVMGPESGALAAGLLLMITNAHKMWVFRKHFEWLFIAATAITMTVALFGGQLIHSDTVPVSFSKFVLGIILGYASYLYMQKNWQLKAALGAAVAASLLGGFIGGLTGLIGLLRGAVLSSFRLKPQVFAVSAGMAGLGAGLTVVLRHCNVFSELWDGQAMLLMALPLLSLVGVLIGQLFIMKMTSAAHSKLMAFALGVTAVLLMF